MAKLADDLEEHITRALAEARDYYDDEVATSVRYIAAEDLFLLVLKSGRRLAIPREDLQDVAGRAWKRRRRCRWTCITRPCTGTGWMWASA